MHAELIGFFEEHKAEGQPLVLATVVDTRGSTYSKSGERLLVNPDGHYRGLLTGGCMEGDLAYRARDVLESGQPTLVDYDFSGDEDELWGMGAGCDGQLFVLLQPLSVENHYEPFASFAGVLTSDRPAVIATVIDGSALGQAVLFSEGDATSLGLEPTAPVAELSRSVFEVRRSVVRKVALDGGDARVHFGYLEPSPRMLILGAAPDVLPLLDMVNVLGWRTTVFDHRPAYVASIGNRAHAICAPAEDLLEHVNVELFDRAMIMSHHLTTDRTYLRLLADSRLNYIGLLGPPSRKARLLSELGDHAHRLEHRVHGPAGLNFGARGPANIALSIVAQIVKLLH